MRFKNEEDREMLTFLHPVLLMIFFDLEHYAQSRHGIELVVTQTYTTKEIDDSLKRVSDAHRTFRAIDIRTKDLDVFVVNDLIEYINNKREYEQYKYMSNSGRKRLAFFHVGTLQHLHISIHKSFSLYNNKTSEFSH